MRLIKYFTLVLLTTTMTGQELQQQKEKNLWNDFTYDIGNVLGGVGYSYSRPFHWKGNDWASLRTMETNMALPKTTICLPAGFI